MKQPIETVPSFIRDALADDAISRVLIWTQEQGEPWDDTFRILCAAVRLNPHGLPIFGAKGLINSRGMVVAHLCYSSERMYWSPIMPKEELFRRVQGIVDALNLDLVEATRLCRFVEGWIQERFDEGQLLVTDRVPDELRNKQEPNR